MLGDNDSVDKSGMTLHRKTYKRNEDLSFYRTREVTVAKIISYNFINGNINLADVQVNTGLAIVHVYF